MRLVAIGNGIQRAPKRDLIGNEMKGTGRVKTALGSKKLEYNAEVTE